MIVADEWGEYKLPDHNVVLSYDETQIFRDLHRWVIDQSKIHPVTTERTYLYGYARY